MPTAATKFVYLNQPLKQSVAASIDCRDTALWHKHRRNRSFRSAATVRTITAMTIRTTKIDILSLTALGFFVAYLAVAFVG